MLILSRRVGESIMIGDDIYCTILGYRGNQISLGFDAPAHIPIHRQEIYQKIKQAEQNRVFSLDALKEILQQGWH